LKTTLGITLKNDLIPVRNKITKLAIAIVGTVKYPSDK
jgi:hypothetical protein